MHGLVLVELQHFLISELGERGWDRLLAEASLGARDYRHVECYPDAEAIQLLDAAARTAGIPQRDLLCRFGEAIAPSLLRLYKVLIRPEWRTLELIERVETTIHQVVRFRNPDAHPPEISSRRLASDEIEISYSSPRGLCAMAIGIARGVAHYYEEAIEVREASCVLRGDASCAISVRSTGSDTALRAIPPAGSFDPTAVTVAAAPAEAVTIRADSEAATRRGAPPAPAAPAPAPAPIEALPGERCGRYELLAEIGRGGMGVVYRAHDPVLDRIVALKILRGHYSDESTERFNREARAVARLRHAGIVPVYDLGDHRGRPFFVMELLEGDTLEQWRLDRSVPEIVSVACEVADTLDFAHAQGIVHRDVKPENIMIHAQGPPILMDFGIARDTGAPDPLEEMGLVIGTPPFMSPEQFEAMPGLIGPHTDIYALGAVLYYCLCGRPVFSADSTSELLRQVLVEPPTPPRKHNADIPPGLESVILRCLEKPSEARYPSAAALAQALQPHRVQ